MENWRSGSEGSSHLKQCGGGAVMVEWVGYIWLSFTVTESSQLPYLGVNCFNIASFAGFPHANKKLKGKGRNFSLAFPYFEQREPGQDLGTRLAYICVCRIDNVMSL